MSNQIEDEENPYYNYRYQTSGSQNINYPQPMPMENTEDEKLPPIYNKPIESIKETSEHQVKYFEPIELSSDEDVNKFLSSGKLMKQIAPKIMQLKQETQKEGMSNDPSVHTEINFDLKQNTAIYEGSEGNNDNDEEQEDNQNIPKKQSGEQSGPGGIKYSSVLPPKYAKMKIVTIDQYGNKKEEGGDSDKDSLDEREENLEEQNNFMSQQQQMALNQEKLREQEQQQLLLQQKKLEQEQMILQQQIQQEQIKQEQIKQQQLIQQKINEERMKQQQLIQQQRIQFQQQNLMQDKRPSMPFQNINPYMRANSDNISINTFNSNMTNRIPFNIKTVKINDQFKNNPLPINQKKKNPIVQKAIKIYGTLRERTQPEPVPEHQLQPQLQPITSNDQIFAIKLIQNKWRNHFILNRFKQIKPQLLNENKYFLKKQYDFCDKAGPIQPDGDFNPEGWKRFYQINDPFFNFNYGFILHNGTKIRHPNDPERVSIYEGDINIQNERHGFGRLTTVKSVYLGHWRNNEFTGWGRETRRSGKVYEGKFVNGLIQGKGILKNVKGVTYYGDFLDSKRHGKGVLDTQKVHYEGQFVDDKLCGKGRIMFKNEGHVYEGEFKNNDINGYGTFKWKNGDSYTGYMSNGKMHGKGKYTYNNGVIYEGIYNNGVKQGKGKIYNTNGVTSSEIQKYINQNNNSKKMNISGVSNMSKNFGNK